MVIRRARTLDTTPIFMQFQYENRHNWGAIVSVIQALEQVCETYAVPLAKLDEEKVVLYASIDLERPCLEELLSCFSNKSEVCLRVCLCVCKCACPCVCMCAEGAVTRRCRPQWPCRGKLGLGREP